MGTLVRTSQSAQTSHDSASFFLTGDLLSRAEEWAGALRLRPTDVSPRGPEPVRRSGHFWCSLFCQPTTFFRRCRPDLPEPKPRPPYEPGPEPPRPDAPGPDAPREW